MPITGTKPELPPVAKRPKCPQCQRRLKVEADVKYTPDGHNYTGTYSYRSYGHFCTLRCGTKYANRVIGGPYPPIKVKP